MGRYDHIIGTELAAGEWGWDEDRAMLYAVGVATGLDDPLRDLHFTTENSPGIQLQVLPTFATLMGIPGNWAEPFGWGGDGLYPVGVVHGEQSVTLARPIPTSGRVRLSKVLNGVYDKGSGALVVMETRINLADTGEYLGSTCMNLFVQGQGNFDGPRRPEGEIEWTRPERDADMVVSLPTGVNQSLIYRLSGDHNQHGTHPEKARADGFPAPIFYGLGTFGVSCRALLRGLCDSDTANFGHIEGRFSKPVLPGDRLDTHIWKTDGGAQFQVLANGERVVLDRGVFRYLKG